MKFSKKKKAFLDPASPHVRLKALDHKLCNEKRIRYISALTCQYIHNATLWGINQKNHEWSSKSEDAILLAVSDAVK